MMYRHVTKAANRPTARRRSYQLRLQDRRILSLYVQWNDEITEWMSRKGIPVTIISFCLSSLPSTGRRKSRGQVTDPTVTFSRDIHPTRRRHMLLFRAEQALIYHGAGRVLHVCLSFNLPVTLDTLSTSTANVLSRTGYYASQMTSTSEPSSSLHLAP